MNERMLETISRLRALDCCALSDALDRLELAGAITHLPRRSGSGSIAGRAVTVKLGTGAPPPGPPRHLCTRAIEMAGPQDVIVIEQRTGVDAGCWGGLLTTGALQRGIVGVVADGPVRDLDEAHAAEFPIFAAGTTCRTARGRVVEEGTNVPVRIGDIVVRPGDFVAADGSGVVCIAAEEIEGVLDAAEHICRKEATMAAAIRSGLATGEVLAGNYENMLRERGR